MGGLSISSGPHFTIWSTIVALFVIGGLSSVGVLQLYFKVALHPLCISSSCLARTSHSSYFPVSQWTGTTGEEYCCAQCSFAAGLHHCPLLLVSPFTSSSFSSLFCLHSFFPSFHPPVTLCSPSSFLLTFLLIFFLSSSHLPLFSPLSHYHVSLLFSCVSPKLCVCVCVSKEWNRCKYKQN